MTAISCTDDLSKEVKDVELPEDLDDHVLQVIKRDPTKQLARLVQLKPHWKDPLASMFAGQQLGGGDNALLLAMLRLGAEPNQPLLAAARASSIECCELLLQLGANPNFQDSERRTALGEAAAQASVECCKLLLRYGAKLDDNAAISPLIDAASAGSVACCELLLKNGIDPNTQDTYHSTPLHKAAEGGHVECCEMLLEHGADATAFNNYIATALHFAALSDSVSCCELLLQRGCGPNVQTVKGETALHLAGRSGSAACCELLLQHGSDPNARDIDGSTPLHEAASASVVECCELLVSYGADAMIRDSRSRLPLQRARRDDDATQGFLISQYFEWDADMFRDLCNQGSTAVLGRYLDSFRIIPHRPHHPARVKVYYHDLHRFYGPPWLPINDTPLFHLLNGSDDIPSLVNHPVFEHVLNIKWAPLSGNGSARNMLEALLLLIVMAGTFQIGVVQSYFVDPSKSLVRHFSGFGHVMSTSEVLLFMLLLVSTCHSFASANSIVSRTVSMVSAVFMLALESLDWNKRRWSFLRHPAHSVRLITYCGVFNLGLVSSAQPALTDIDMAQALLFVMLCVCGLDHLRVVTLASLLIAIVLKMITNVFTVIGFCMVFQIGFSGSFFLLFQHEDSRYNSYGEAFLATFLMLFGDFDADLFLRLEGVKAVVANVLVLLYLVGAMVMLMNLLIATMSTSYQEVLDSAKAAQSIARAETILRMESLLPHRVRAHMFEALVGLSASRKLHALHDTEQKSTRDLFDATDASSVQTNVCDGAVGVTKRVEAGSRPVMPAPRKPIWRKMKRSRKDFVETLTNRPCLTDCVVFEYVGMKHSIAHHDLLHRQTVMEAKLEKNVVQQAKNHEELVRQLEFGREEMRKRARRQEMQANHQGFQLESLMQTLLTRMDDLQAVAVNSDRGNASSHRTQNAST